MNAAKQDRRRSELTLATVQKTPEATRLFKSLGAWGLWGGV